MSSEIESRFARLVEYARAMDPVLERSSYYDLMELPPDADIPTIRAAYYRAAATLHPDRYHALPDPEVKLKLAAIYSRISEGYRVLTNPQRRAVYDKGLAQGQTRLQSTEREKKGPQNPDEVIAHPEAKKFFRLAMQAMARKDLKGALMNLKFARSFDAETALIAEKLAEVETALRPPPK